MSAERPKPADGAELVDASRRTHLAGERTQLAWWRRAALEKALREGRFLESAAWPLRTLTVGGLALGLLTAAIILFD